MKTDPAARPSCLEALEPRALFSAPGDTLPNITDTATDTAGNVYRAGRFTGTVDFDPSASQTSNLTAQSTDAYVAKFAPDGTLLWAKRWGNAVPIALPKIGVTPAGAVFLAADFSGTIDLDPSAGTSNIAQSGTNPNVFLARLDTDGHLVRANAFSTPGQDMLAADVVTTPDGHIALVANGNVPGIQDSDDYKGDCQFYLLNARLRTVVHDRWATLDPFGVVQAYSVAAGPTGAVYISGAHDPSVDFAPGRRVRTAPGRLRDSPFLLRVAPTGRFDWVVGYEGAFDDTLLIDHVDADDTVHVAGRYNAATDFNPSPRKQFHLHPANNSYGTYTALFSPRGALISAEDVVLA
jgi:hypothetical protein